MTDLSDARFERREKLLEKQKKNSLDYRQETIRLAATSDKDALCRLSDAYWIGDGVDADPAYAIELCEQAAILGSADAQFRMGVRYLNGHVVDQDADRGVSYLRQAAEQGHGTSQLMLARILSSGSQIENNQDEARRWAKAVSDSKSDSDKAMDKALSILRGKSTTQKYQKAAPYLLQAADGGVAYAPTLLGGMYADGVGVEQSYYLSYFWYTVSAHRGSYNCHQAREALLRRAPIGSISFSDIFLRAIHGDPRAQFLVGASFDRGELVSRNKAEAHYWFTVSAESGFRLASEVISSGSYKHAPGAHLIAERGLMPLNAFTWSIRSSILDRQFLAALLEPYQGLAQVLRAYVIRNT